MLGIRLMGTWAEIVLAYFALAIAKRYEVSALKSKSSLEFI